ncbi:MAG: EVE domain-containing protein [Gammaproteobacteria bacterium]
MSDTKNWIAVASAEHVRIGRAHGFMQVCHGKAAPLKRLRPGDRVAYYSPTEQFGGKDKLRAFTAIGTVKDGQPYQASIGPGAGGGFCPFRRDVWWLPAAEAGINPLLDTLEFTVGNRNWGYQLRFGLFEVSAHDMDVIAAAMGAQVDGLPALEEAQSTLFQD